MGCKVGGVAPTRQLVDLHGQITFVCQVNHGIQGPRRVWPYGHDVVKRGVRTYMITSETLE